jgi:hypothetical protein
MNLINRTVAVAAGILLLSGCGSSPSRVSVRPNRRIKSAHRSASALPGIHLPPNSQFSLPQEPGDGPDALMMDGVYSLVSDGVTVVASAGRPEKAKTTDGFDTVATPLRIVEVLAGDPHAEAITLLAGDPTQQLTEGHRYILVLSPATESPVPDGYTAGSTTSMLEETDNGRWVSLDKSVTVTIDEMRSVILMSERHLAERRRAGQAKLEVQVDNVGGQSRATVSGYADGESLGIKFCHATNDPSVVPPIQSCDSRLGVSVTPTGGNQTFDFVPPQEIRLNPDQAIPCDGHCVLVVYDLDFPSKVFATVSV